MNHSIQVSASNKSISLEQSTTLFQMYHQAGEIVAQNLIVITQAVDFRGSNTNAACADLQVKSMQTGSEQGYDETKHSKTSISTTVDVSGSMKEGGSSSVLSGSAGSLYATVESPLSMQADIPER